MKVANQSFRFIGSHLHGFLQNNNYFFFFFASASFCACTSQIKHLPSLSKATPVWMWQVAGATRGAPHLGHTSGAPFD